MPPISFHVLKIILTVFSLFLTACQAVVNESGNIIDPEKVVQIQTGLSNRDDVLKLLGPPTLINTFRQERWIYIQDRQFKNIQRTFSRVTNRIEITFDANGLVKNLQRNFDDALYDPRDSAAKSQDKAYGKWLLGGEFSKPVTDPNPEAAKKNHDQSVSLKEGDAIHVPEETKLELTSTPEAKLFDTTADKPATQETNTVPASDVTAATKPDEKKGWSLWPWGKKDKTSADTPAASPPDNPEASSAKSPWWPFGAK